MIAKAKINTKAPSLAEYVTRLGFDPSWLPVEPLTRKQMKLYPITRALLEYERKYERKGVTR